MSKQLLTKCKYKKEVYKRRQQGQEIPWAGRLFEEWDQESLDKYMRGC